MSTVTLRIPTPLRAFTGGEPRLQVEASTVREALRVAGSQHTELTQRILDDTGELRTFVNLFVGSANVDQLDGLETKLSDKDVLAILPAVAGGSSKPGSRGRLEQLKASIPEVTPAQAQDLLQSGGLLIDVREADEVAQGSPPAAHRLVRGFLELRVEAIAPDLDQTLLLLCAGGVRSLFAADDLKRIGYRDVRSVLGGFSRWKADGLPFEVPLVLNDEQRERYARHLLMPEIGEAGQLRLLSSKVLLVGAGGLGSPAALYLAAAGIGTLGIVDDDVVDRSNLQRQILHRDARVGQPKVDSARETLQGLNPKIEIRTYQERVEAGNVDEIFGDYDIIIDGSDNFPTRYLVNDACVKLGIPNVHGSIFRFEGQVSVFSPGHTTAAGLSGPCYRCVYPTPPPAELAPSCAEAGVLGVLPGIVGTLEALEAIKLLLDIGNSLVGRLLAFDALAMEFAQYDLVRNPTCPACGDDVQITSYSEYAQVCGVAN